MKVELLNIRNTWIPLSFGGWIFFLVVLKQNIEFHQNAGVNSTKTLQWSPVQSTVDSTAVKSGVHRSDHWAISGIHCSVYWNLLQDSHSIGVWLWNPMRAATSAERKSAKSRKRHTNNWCVLTFFSLTSCFFKKRFDIVSSAQAGMIIVAWALPGQLFGVS